MIRIFYALLITGAVLMISTACHSPAKEETSQEEATTYILVRHAEKADDGTKDPPLSERGKQRAERLAQMLISADVSAIYSTDYQRTQQTASPLAGKINLKVGSYNPSKEEDFMHIQREAIGKTTLIVGHSNTIPVMVNQLLGQERFSNLAENEYDKLFIVTRMGELAKITILNY